MPQLENTGAVAPAGGGVHGQASLCIFAPTIATVSETFILRHMRDLLPGRTVVVAGTEDGVGLDERVPRLLLGVGDRATRSGRAAGGFRNPEAHAGDVAAFLRRHRVAVALGEYLTWSHPWIQIARAAGIRFYAHAHGYDVSRKLRDPEWRARYLDYNEADGVVTVSHVSRQRLIEAGIRAEKIAVIPCGVDVPVEPPPPPADGLVRCLAVGRMVDKKAPSFTLEAFRLAAARCEGLALDFIGGGPLLTAAEEYVRRHDLGGRVRLLGPQPHGEVLRAMAGASIFVQHSRIDPVTGDEEGLPVSILEAMAHARPVVSTRHGGIPEAVLDGVTGRLVDEGDVAAMADCLVALAADPEGRVRLGRAGWERARDAFSWTHERAALLRLTGLDAADSPLPDLAGSVSVSGNPLVSVIVPAYNRAATITRCLESIRAQTYPHWEVVVVDDGSQDGTAEATRAVGRQDGRIQLLTHPERRGAQAARNTGIRGVRGEWVAFLDSDDEYMPHSLESRLRRAIEDRCQVVHSACRVRTEEGRIEVYRVPRLAGHVHEQLLRHEGPVFPALLASRQALESIGLLDEQILAFQEWDTSIRLARRYAFAFEPRPTFIYDCSRPDAMSKNLLRNGRAYEQVMRKHFLAMLRHGGPRGIAEHYRRAGRWYERAGAEREVRRCRRLAQLWSCCDPALVWNKVRVSLVREV